MTLILRIYAERAFGKTVETMPKVKCISSFLRYGTKTEDYQIRVFFFKIRAISAQKQIGRLLLR